LSIRSYVQRFVVVVVVVVAVAVGVVVVEVESHVTLLYVASASKNVQIIML
jgi:cytochrome c-type biogenesis protein CcmE